MSPTPEKVNSPDHIEAAEISLLNCSREINGLVAGIVAIEGEKTLRRRRSIGIFHRKMSPVPVVGFLVDNNCVTVLLGGDGRGFDNMWAVGGKNFGQTFPAWQMVNFNEKYPWGIAVQWGGNAGKIDYPNCNRVYGTTTREVKLIDERFKQLQETGFFRAKSFAEVLSLVQVHHHPIEDKAAVAEFFLKGLKRTAGWAVS